MDDPVIEHVLSRIFGRTIELRRTSNNVLLRRAVKETAKKINTTWHREEGEARRQQDEGKAWLQCSGLVREYYFLLITRICQLAKRENWKCVPHFLKSEERNFGSWKVKKGKQSPYNRMMEVACKRGTHTAESSQYCACPFALFRD